MLNEEGETNYEQQKMEYEGKVLLAEEAIEFLKDAMEDIKESAKVQHEKDKESSADRKNSFDYSTAQRELGYKTRPYKETIKDEIAWLKANGHI